MRPLLGSRFFQCFDTVAGVSLIRPSKELVPLILHKLSCITNVGRKLREPDSPEKWPFVVTELKNYYIYSTPLHEFYYIYHITICYIVTSHIFYTLM